MAVKPALDPKWSASNNPLDNIEPTESLKIGGVPAGGVWGREFLNWQFYAISQWIDWVRSSALDKDNNLNDLTDAATARTNLGLNNTSVTLGANIATADKLKTARTIGGVSFDGSANINLPGVNIAGNQNTSGNAATATYATSAGSANYATSAGSATTVSNTSHTHTTSQVLAATAGASFGAVGTYAYLAFGLVVTEGLVYSGASLHPAGLETGGIPWPDLRSGAGITASGGTVSGAWKAMGRGASSANYHATLFLRVS